MTTIMLTIAVMSLIVMRDALRDLFAFSTKDKVAALIVAGLSLTAFLMSLMAAVEASN